jgi:hypothetical protein
MRKFLPALFSLFAVAILSACASAQPTTDTVGLQKMVLQAEIAYQIPLRGAITVKNWPTCKTPATVKPCIDEGSRQTIRKVNASVVALFDKAMDTASIPGVAQGDVTADIQAAVKAAEALKTLVNTWSPAQ